MDFARTTFAIVAIALMACGRQPKDTVPCERLVARYAVCQIADAIDQDACVERFGNRSAACQTSMATYVRCVEATSCTRLADASQGLACKNEYVGADIDCGS